MEDSKTIFNMSIATLETIRFLMNEVHRYREVANAKGMLNMLESLYLEVEPFIEKKDRLAKGKELRTECRRSVYLQDEEEGLILEGVYNKLYDWEMFIRVQLKEMGALLPFEDSASFALR